MSLLPVLLLLLQSPDPPTNPLTPVHPFKTARIRYKGSGGTEATAWIEGARAAFRRTVKKDGAVVEEQWNATDGKEIWNASWVRGTLETSGRRPHAGAALAELLKGYSPERRAAVQHRIESVWRRWSPVFVHDFLTSPCEFHGMKADTVAGKPCWALRFSTTSNWTAWFWKGTDIILKVEDAGLVLFEAAKIEENVDLGEEAFKPPGKIEFAEAGERARREAGTITELFEKPPGGEAQAEAGGAKYRLGELRASVLQREDARVLEVKDDDWPWHFNLRLRLTTETLAASAGMTFTRTRKEGEDEAVLVVWDDLHLVSKSISVKIDKVGEDSVELTVGAVWVKRGKRDEEVVPGKPIRMKVPLDR